MTTKAAFVIKKVNTENPREIDHNFQEVYATRLESKWKRDSSGIAAYTFQSQETGEVDFSANGSPVTTLTFALKEKQQTVIYAVAQARSLGVTAHVTDVTQTAITIACAPRLVWDQAVSTSLALMNFSQATTATVKVYYCVVGSNP